MFRATWVLYALPVPITLILVFSTFIYVLFYFLIYYVGDPKDGKFPFEPRKVITAIIWMVLAALLLWAAGWLVSHLFR